METSEKRWDIMKDLGDGPLPASIISPYDQAEMVLIPKGTFIMGIDENELKQIYALDERQIGIFLTEIPRREIYLDDFYIDRYPVTNFQYQTFIGETKHRKPWLIDQEGWNDPYQPVVGVGWDDARAYVRWAGKSLPIEEQWEKSARGIDGRWWPWGNDFHIGHCNSRESRIGRTTDVTLFDKGMSPYGCYDMSGNVWEMCEGKWAEDHLPMRGGCFLGGATFVRTTVRWSPEDQVNGAHWLGFRCVQNIPKRRNPL